MKFNYSKLLGRIVEKYGTRSAFAEKVGESSANVSAKLRGVRTIDSDDIYLWCQLLDISEIDVSDYFFNVGVQDTEQSGAE